MSTKTVSTEKSLNLSVFLDELVENSVDFVENKMSFPQSNFLVMVFYGLNFLPFCGILRLK